MKQYILSLTLCVLFALTACTKYTENSLEDFKVSATELSIPAEGEEHTLTIETGGIDWEAISEASWIQTQTTSATALSITTDPNYTPQVRTAQIKVIASGVVKTILVTQQGVPAEAKLFPASAELDQFGGDNYFYVSSNTQGWTLESDVAWITTKPNYTKRRAELTIEENTATAAREGTVSLIDNGTVLGTYKVVQEGAQLFILPLTEFLSNPYEVQAFEKKRRSTLVKLPDGFVNSSTYGFATRSPLFPTVEYSFTNNQYVEAKLFPVDNSLIDNLEYKAKIVEFLKSKDFLFDFGSIYVHPDLNIEASLIPSKADAKAHIYFRFLPTQPDGMPVFTEFPYGCLDFKIGDEEKVKAYEAANGGTFVPEMSSATDLYFKTPPPILYRIYYLGNQSAQAFEDYQYGYFFHQGTPYLTREFRKMLAEEGFELLTKLDFVFYMYKYRNDKKKLFLDVWLRKENVNGTMKYVMRFNIKKMG